MAFLHFFTSGPNHTTRRKLTPSYFSFVQPWIRPLPFSFSCALFIGGIPFGALNPCIYRLRQFDISFCLLSSLHVHWKTPLSSDEPDRINGSVSRLSHIFISSLHGTGRVAGNAREPPSALPYSCTYCSKASFIQSRVQSVCSPLPHPKTSFRGMLGVWRRLFCIQEKSSCCCFLFRLLYIYSVWVQNVYRKNAFNSKRFLVLLFVVVLCQ